jgi:Tol biopolymer transport system component
LVVHQGINSVNVKTAGVRKLVTDGWGFHSPRCTPDGKSVLYEDDSGEADRVFRVMSHDVESGKAKEVYRSSAQIIRMDISPDGRWVAFLEPADAALKVMPPQGGQPRVLHKFDLDKGIWSTSLAWSPDGKYIYFTKGGGGKLGSFDLWRIPSAGGEAVRLDVTAPGMENLDVHPDGRRIAFNSWQMRREVWVMENFLPAAKGAR